VGWSMSPRQDRQLVVQAVLMALWQRPARTPVILHSDRGCQFTSEEYQRFLEAHQVICSMSAVGSCADNAAAESFFGVLKRGHQVTVLTRRYDPALLCHEILNGVQIERLWPSGRGVFAKWLMDVGVWRRIARAKPPYDLIFVTQFSAHLLGAALGAARRHTTIVIRTDQHDEFSGAISDQSLRRLPFGIRNVIGAALRGARAWAYRRVDFVIALSKALAREAEAFGFQRESVVLSANAVNLERFRPVMREEKIALRASLGIAPDAEVVTYVGRLVQGKGHVTLLEAWAGIAQERPQALLLLVGGGPAELTRR